MIQFEIPGPVTGKGRPRFARMGSFVRAYTDSKTQSYENLVKHYASVAMRGAPPMDRPVHLGIVVYKTPPASMSKRRREEALNGITRPIGKPDLDNIAKGISDAMNKIVYTDDKCVASLTVERRWGDIERACVIVQPIGSSK